jgi:peptidoglycan/LPS O-acetylase OafA/YrhL
MTPRRGGGAMTHAAWLGRTYFANFDGLRALCILAVLWHHAPVWYAWTAPHQIAGRGFLGVDMFFVLSGFLITTLLLRERARTGRSALGGFYARRARRILPPYFLVVTAVAVFYIGLRGETQWLDELPFYYLFLANFLTEHMPFLGPMWSLAVEEQYYLVWPLLMILMPPRALVGLVLALVAVNVAGGGGWLAPLGLRPVEWGPLTLQLPNATYAPILLGSLGAILIDHPRGFAALAPWLTRPGAGWAALAGVALVAGWGPADVRGWPNLAMHLLMLAALMAMALREQGALARTLRWAPLARLGRVSYGVYLYHLIGLHAGNLIAGRLGLGLWEVFVIYSAISWLMAEASWRWWESLWRQRRPRPVPA